MKKKQFLILSLVIFMCIGCKKDTPIVDVEGEKQEAINTFFQLQMQEYCYDDRPYSIMSTVFTVSENFFYFTASGRPNARLNFSNGQTEVVCSTLGCDHFEVKSCEAKDTFNGLAIGEEQLLVVRDNKLYLRDEDTEELIFTNTYSTEVLLEEYGAPNYTISFLVMQENMLLIVCWDHFYVYDMSTRTASKPYELQGVGLNGGILSCGVAKGKMYFSNASNELYEYDIEKCELQKLRDKVTRVYPRDGIVYFTEMTDKKEQRLYSWDVSRQEKPRLLTEDAYVELYIDDRIYYVNLSDDILYIMDLDGNNRIEIEMEDRVRIYSHPSLDSIFLLTDDKFCIFNKDSLECRVLDYETNMRLYEYSGSNY